MAPSYGQSWGDVKFRKDGVRTTFWGTLANKVGLLGQAPENGTHPKERMHGKIVRFPTCSAIDYTTDRI